MKQTVRTLEGDLFNLACCLGFAAGSALILDSAGALTPHIRIEDPQQADRRALASDWTITGEDIQTSVQAFERQAA